MRRSVITWSIVFVLLFATFAGTVITLNATLYSASGFVRSYLDALSRADSTAALEIPGVRTANEADATLLSDEAMGELDDIRFLSDTVGRDGLHTVTFEYSLGDDTTGSTSFTVAPAGSRFGLFPRWKFATSPLTTVAISVLHDQQVDVNGLAVTSKARPNQPASFLTFTPGRYLLEHNSAFLAAEPVTVDVTTIGAITDVAVDVQANDEFVAKLQVELNGFLDSCATQTVLMPTACPFGRPVSNRVVSQPAWSIVAYPTAVIVPGDEPGTWSMPPTEGAAHLAVDIRSLFDGTVSTLDEDVPFTVQYRIEIEGGRSLLITAID